MTDFREPGQGGDQPGLLGDFHQSQPEGHDPDQADGQFHGDPGVAQDPLPGYGLDRGKTDGVKGHPGRSRRGAGRLPADPGRKSLRVVLGLLNFLPNRRCLGIRDNPEPPLPGTEGREFGPLPQGAFGRQGPVIEFLENLRVDGEGAGDADRGGRRLSGEGGLNSREMASSCPFRKRLTARSTVSFPMANKLPSRIRASQI